MKPFYYFLSLLVFTALGYGQGYKTVTIIKQRSYYLNGGARATLADGKSREVLKIDLPARTKACYYSFSTTAGEDGTQLLNLGLQLGASIYGGAIGSAVASKIKVPLGSEAIDVYALTAKNASSFMTKDDEHWTYFRDISVQNAKEAVQYIDPAQYGYSFYLGLRNPTAMSGIGITIEVVALVDEDHPNADRGVLYGNMGWQSFVAKDYDKSIAYGTKALIFNPNLTYVRFNLALTYLVQEKEEAVDSYIEAIALSNKDKKRKELLENALRDLRDVKEQHPTLKNIITVEQLLVNEKRK